MFLERGNEGRNNLGSWIAMIIVVLVVSQFIGAIPLQVMISMKMSVNPDLQPNPENPLDLSAYDIAPITGIVLMIIPFVFGLIALLVSMKPIHERPMLSVLTGYPDFRWNRFFWGAKVWFVLLAVYAIFASVAGIQKVELQFDPATLIKLSAVSLLFLPLQAGFEEGFFRGYLMQGFSQIFKYKWLTLLVTSLIFGGLHIFNPEVKELGALITLPQYIWFGFVLGICAIMDEGLELAWGVHTINNIFLSVFFTQDSSALPTPALYRITEFNPVFDLIALILLTVLFIYIAHYKFKWPEWRYLLGRIGNAAVPEEDSGDYFDEEYDQDDDK